MNPRRLGPALLASCLLTLLCLRPAPVRGCSCVPPKLERLALPAAGATDFPRDGRIRIFVSGGFAAPLRKRLAEEYRLKDDKGAVVPVRVRLEGTMITLVPRALFQPKTKYTLERVSVYDQRGQRVSDDDRWKIALNLQREDGQPTGQLTRRWSEETWFVTGASVDRRRPSAPVIEEARVHFKEGSGDCGPGGDVFIRYKGAVGLVPTDVLEVERRGEGFVWRIPIVQEIQLPDGARQVLYGDTLCMPDKVTVTGARHDVRLSVLPASDRRVTARKFATAAVEGSVIKAGSGGERPGVAAEEAATQRWFAPPLQD